MALNNEDDDALDDDDEAAIFCAVMVRMATATIPDDGAVPVDSSGGSMTQGLDCTD